MHYMQSKAFSWRGRQGVRDSQQGMSSSSTISSSLSGFSNPRTAAVSALVMDRRCAWETSQNMGDDGNLRGHLGELPILTWTWPRFQPPLLKPTSWHLDNSPLIIPSTQSHFLTYFQVSDLLAGEEGSRSALSVSIWVGVSVSRSGSLISGPDIIAMNSTRPLLHPLPTMVWPRLSSHFGRPHERRCHFQAQHRRCLTTLVMVINLLPNSKFTLFSLLRKWIWVL